MACIVTQGVPWISQNTKIKFFQEIDRAKNHNFHSGNNPLVSDSCFDS